MGFGTTWVVVAAVDSTWEFANLRHCAVSLSLSLSTLFVRGRGLGGNGGSLCNYNDCLWGKGKGRWVAMGGVHGS